MTNVKRAMSSQVMLFYMKPRTLIYMDKTGTGQAKWLGTAEASTGGGGNIRYEDRHIEADKLSDSRSKSDLVMFVQLEH